MADDKPPPKPKCASCGNQDVVNPGDKCFGCKLNEALKKRDKGK